MTTTPSYRLVRSMSALDVRPGDVIICDESHRQVEAINVHRPGTHGHSPLDNGCWAVELVTEGAGTRWVRSASNVNVYELDGNGSAAR